MKIFTFITEDDREIDSFNCKDKVLNKAYVQFVHSKYEEVRKEWAKDETYPRSETSDWLLDSIEHITIYDLETNETIKIQANVYEQGKWQLSKEFKELDLIYNHPTNVQLGKDTNLTKEQQDISDWLSQSYKEVETIELIVLLYETTQQGEPIHTTPELGDVYYVNNSVFSRLKDTFYIVKSSTEYDYISDLT